MSKVLKEIADRARAYAIKQNETTAVPYSQAYESKFNELVIEQAQLAVAQSQWMYQNTNTNQRTQNVVKTYLGS